MGTLMARHYALHALVHVFPKTGRLKLCGWVGCPGKPASFWTVSWNLVNGKRRAPWFDDAAYDRVIRAIEAARTLRAVTVPVPAPIPSSVPRPAPGAAAVASIVDDRPVMDKSGFGGAKPRFDFVPASKADLYEELRRAVANTPPRATE
jgi:hypothetical protein